MEHVVHPKGHVAQKNQKRQVAPLEHMVRLEGHVALKETNLNSPKTITP